MPNFVRTLSIMTLLTFTQFAVAAANHDPDARKAKVYDFTVASYAEAQASNDFLKFDLDTTFLFFFDDTVTGYAKKINVAGDFVDSQLRNAVITIEAQSLDSNSERRNRRFLEHSFNAQTYPNIIIRFGAPIQLNGSPRSKVAGSIEVRGSSKPLEVNFVTKETHDAYVVDGDAEISITTLGIPSPSTFFTKVHDKIALKLHFDVKKEAIKDAKTEEEKAKEAAAAAKAAEASATAQSQDAATTTAAAQEAPAPAGGPVTETKPTEQPTPETRPAPQPQQKQKKAKSKSK